MIGQKKIKIRDYVNNATESPSYNCFYCNNPSNLEELLRVDKKLREMDAEMHEFLLGILQGSSNPRMSPFIHECDLGYDVLNICLNCYKRAKKELFER